MYTPHDPHTCDSIQILITNLFLPGRENHNIRICKSLCNGPKSYIIVLLCNRNSINGLILKVRFKGQEEMLSQDDIR